MQLVSVVKEFCDYNKDNWCCHNNFDENGLYVDITSKDRDDIMFDLPIRLLTMHEKHIHAIHIESNQLCIALKSKIMIYLDGDNGHTEISSGDSGNPMFKDLK